MYYDQQPHGPWTPAYSALYYAPGMEHGGVQLPFIHPGHQQPVLADPALSCALAPGYGLPPQGPRYGRHSSRNQVRGRGRGRYSEFGAS